MNDLDLPPRRELPSDVRDRIRTAVHTGQPGARTPRRRTTPAVAAAAAVLLLAVAAVVTRPTDDVEVGTAGPVTSGDLTLTQPDTQTEADLDRCAAVAEASPRAHEYSPRETWSPMFTVHRELPRGDAVELSDDTPPTARTIPGGTYRVRIVAFRDSGDMPVFCELWNDHVVLSDPGSEPITLARNDAADIYAVYWSMRTDVLVGVALGVTAMAGEVLPYHDLRPVSAVPAPLVQDGLFAMQTDKVVTQDRVEVVGYDRAGDVVVDGGRAFDQSIVWPGGASTG